MTRSAIDLKIVSDRLEIVRSAVGELQALPHSTLDVFRADRRNIWSSDSLLRRAIEALFDTARHVLAKAYGRGGLEYRDVARLAVEHGVISLDVADQFVRIAGFRNRLTHHYDAVTPEELFTVIQEHLGDITRVADQLEASAARLASATDSPPDTPASEPPMPIPRS
jgi:uncharacterized protein YutE (UPF0331/DUF86 family)